METLSNIQCFVRSAEAGSFAEAARRLGLTPAGVGKNVARLESNLGVRLFQRSTRRLTLTEAGERFLQEVGGSLEGIQTALANVSSVGNQPSGTLKVSMGLAFGRDYILPLLGEFLERYPDIVPDWHFDNRQVDLIGEGFDAAIGGGFELPPGVVARNLTPGHLILLASPAYLRDKPPIRHPGDLGGFDGIRIRSPQTGRVRSWPLRRRNGEEAPIEPARTHDHERPGSHLRGRRHGPGHHPGMHAARLCLPGVRRPGAGPAGLVRRRRQHQPLLRGE